MEYLYQELTGSIINAAMEVHRILGPGLLESTYEECLCHELTLRKIPHVRQQNVSINFKGLVVHNAYRIDIIVEEKVILELKSVEELIPVHEAQLLTHMKLKNIRIGLIINFNVPVLKEGIRRRIL